MICWLSHLFSPKELGRKEVLGSGMSCGGRVRGGAGKVPGIFCIGYILDQGVGGRGALRSPPSHPDLGIARAPIHLEPQHFVSEGRGCPTERKPDTSSPGWASTVGLLEWAQNTYPCLCCLKTPSQGRQVERALTSSQENPVSSTITLKLAE